MSGSGHDLMSLYGFVGWSPGSGSALRVEPDTGLDPRSLSVGVNVEHKISHYTWLAKI